MTTSVRHLFDSFLQLKFIDRKMMTSTTSTSVYTYLRVGKTFFSFSRACLQRTVEHKSSIKRCYDLINISLTNLHASLPLTSTGHAQYTKCFRAWHNQKYENKQKIFKELWEDFETCDTSIARRSKCTVIPNIRKNSAK